LSILEKKDEEPQKLVLLLSGDSAFPSPAEANVRASPVVLGLPRPKSGAI
jgi:hypothetical protein